VPARVIRAPGRRRDAGTALTGDPLEAVPDRVGVDVEACRGSPDVQFLGDVGVEGLLDRRWRADGALAGLELS
jgi:hypothetical protein